MIYSTKETAYGLFGCRSYHIEVDVSDPRRPMQRHVWTRYDGGIEYDDWIPTPSGIVIGGRHAGVLTVTHVVQQGGLPQ